MATTRKLRRADGRTVYHVQIRLKDYASQTATFDRKADADEWAARTEAALRERRHFPDRERRRLKFGELIDKFIQSEIEERATRDITRLTNQGGVHERMHVRPGDVSCWVESVASGVKRVEASLVAWT